MPVSKKDVVRLIKEAAEDAEEKSQLLGLAGDRPNLYSELEEEDAVECLRAQLRKEASKELEDKWQIDVQKYTTTSDDAEPAADSYLDAIGICVPPAEAKSLWLHAKRRGKATLSMRIFHDICCI